MHTSQILPTELKSKSKSKIFLQD